MTEVATKPKRAARKKTSATVDANVTIAPVTAKPSRRKPAAAKTTATATAPVVKAASKGRRPAKRTVSAPAPVKNPRSNQVAKKTSATKGTGRGFNRTLNVHGFVPGSDTAIIVEALLKGGKDRHDTTAKAVTSITKANGIETRGGATKNVPSLISGLMSRLAERGYKVESTWTLVAPAAIVRKMEAEASAAASANTIDTDTTTAAPKARRKPASVKGSK